LLRLLDRRAEVLRPLDVHLGAGEDVLGQAEVADLADLAAVLAAAGLAAGARGHLARLRRLDPLDAKRQPPPVGVDLEDLDLDVVARLDYLARVLDVVLGELGDVDQPLDALHDLDEGAEGDDLGDLALELVADAI